VTKEEMEDRRGVERRPALKVIGAAGCYGLISYLALGESTTQPDPAPSPQTFYDSPEGI